jgi:DNA polymerase zeta
VVYGDTDSIFVYLRGRTKEQAFLIGHDIADTITAANPAPIKLKFEKVNSQAPELDAYVSSSPIV